MLACAFASSVLLLVAALAGHVELLAYAAPLLMVGLPLLAGRYVGEERLERWRSRTVCPSRRRILSSLPEGRRSAVLVPRGSRLIGHSLAERAPPAPLLS